MCKPMSGVLTKTGAFWSANSERHEDIISEHKLHADGVKGPNILRFEVTPPDEDMTRPVSQWVFRVDQDIMPSWYNQETDEKRARVVLTEWHKKKVITGPAILKDGQFYVISSDSATVEASGSATVRAYGSATVRAYGSATVEAYNSATVRAYDSATVRAYDSATVICYTVIDPTCLKSTLAVLIDRSVKGKVTIHVGKA